MLLDFFGRRVLLTGEAWGHIVGRRPYMADFRTEIAETLLGPDEIRRSSSVPETASLYYKWYYGTAVGDKGLGVVVKALPAEAFVVTAYCTGRIKEGERYGPTEASRSKADRSNHRPRPAGAGNGQCLV